MALSNFTVPRLSFDAVNGWDFEIRINARLNFPSLNFTLPPINGLTIRKTGITIPAITIPEISDSFRTFNGFAIKPPAFRMQQFTFNWFTMQGTSLNNWGFSFDFELGFQNMPNAIPEQVRNIRLRILNAGFNNGKITGNIAAQNFSGAGLQLPLGGTANFLIKQIGGNLAESGGNQDFNITISGDIQLPEFMRCGGSNGIQQAAGASLKIDSRGKLSGQIRNFIPSCPMNLGIGNLVITNSTIFFELSGSAQTIRINLAGNLKLPSNQQGDSITASGNLSFDILTGRMLEGQISINQAFLFKLPSAENPVMVFRVTSAVLNRDGLRINGSASLNLGGGSSSVIATFNDFLLNFQNMTVVSGTATFQNPFALKFVVGSGGLQWSAIGVNDAVSEQTAVRLTLPNNIRLTSQGVSCSGETSVLIRFNGIDRANIRCIFSNDFNLSYSPFRVKSGSARFFLGETLAGVLDGNGFAPGDILGLIPLPEKLPLPDTTVAYLVIRQGNNNLVQSEPVAGGIRIMTRVGQTVRLVVPGLKFNGAPPEALISFNVVVNSSTFRLVSGSITVATPPGQSGVFNLSNLGVPFNITRLKYENVNGSPVMMLSARLILPQAIGGATISVDSLVLRSHGIEGSITAGSYSVHHSEDEEYIARVNIGNYGQFKVSGLAAVVRSQLINIRMSGDITADIFRDNNGQQTPIHWYASWVNGNFNFSFDLQHIPNQQIPMLIATFRPLSVGGNPAFSLDLSNNNFALTLSGALRIPSLGDGFIVSFSGLRISNTGITVPNVSVNVSNQNFNLFGARFALRNLSANEPAISFAYTNRVLYLTLNGDITFFENVSQFRGLRIGSNGTVTINQVNLLSRDLMIVQNHVGISRLSIGQAGMRVDGFVKMPQPADTARQAFNFTVSPQGEITGGANISVIDENRGIGSGDRTEWSFWIATFDLTYVKINLDFANFRRSTVHVISDIYFMNDVNKYVKLGYKQGGTAYPGLTIRFDGNIQWGNIQVASGLTNIDWDALKINLTNIGFNTPSISNLKLQLSGRISVSLQSVSGGLDFNNLRISSTGGVENLPQSITGGNFSIASVVTLSVNSISYSSTPTSIWVKGGSTPGGGSGGRVDSTRVNVNSYFRFGATINISGVASGGIEEFLMYKSGNTTNLTIRNAQLSIPNVLSFRADLVYNRSGNNFYLLLGGKGRLVSQYEVIIIGKVAQRDGSTSFGVFVAATGLSITIPPAIVLTGLGGGFFYNPDPADLTLVRNMCGLDGGTANRIQASPGRFAVLIYAQANIISSSLVTGKVLLTVTQNYFEMYGRVVLLNQENRFNGTFYLHIGFNNSRAEGQINITVNYSPLVSGTAQLGFYFYRNNVWGVDGRLSVRILSLVTCNADLFIGNPGFYISMSAGFSFDIWILAVNAGMEVKIWHIRANNQWGAYGNAYVAIRIIGINFGGLGFTAAWISNQMLYGEAYISTPWPFDDIRVWGAIYNGRTDGGTGGNSTYRQRISEALTTAGNMRNQRDAALRDINNARGGN